MTKRFGFTLAEVLITLGIIGVVAAMTIPTLISNTNGAQFKTAYKKALSTLNQAVLMNLAMDDTDFSTLKAHGADTSPASGSLGDMLLARMQSATELKDASYASTPTLTEGTGTTAKAPDMSYTLACTGDGNTTPPDGVTGTCENGVVKVEATMDTTVANYKKYSFADGTAFWYHKDAVDCKQANVQANKCYGFIDVNGANNPNTLIYCANASTKNTCESSEITDIFPVIFWGQTVEPATDSARAVLFGK